MTKNKSWGTRFWLVLAVLSAIAALPQLLWPPARTGGVFFGVLAVCCFGEYLMLRNREQHVFFRFFARAGQILFGLFLVSFVLVQAVIFGGMRADPQASEANAVLVLGARVYESGVPSATLQKRIDTAKTWLDAHPETVAVLCGGQGANEPFPEAHAMRDALAAQGISEERLIIEDASNNTIQNIANAKQLLTARYPDGFTTAVISSDFHLARARRLMVHAGLDPYAVPAPTPYFAQRLALHLREYGSIMGLVLTGRW